MPRIWAASPLLTNLSSRTRRYLHGGGWSIGDVVSFDRLSRRLADTAGTAVLTLDYRLTPEHPWPAAVDDAVTALRWVSSGPAELGALTGAVAVVGDSAGGTLAALACLRLRDTSPAALPACRAAADRVAADLGRLLGR
jgi:acetyl esterase